MGDGRLQGRTAVVTGGGGGIGRATSLALAAEGAAVLIDDIRRDDDGTDAATAVAAEIQQEGGRALAHDGDITSVGGAAGMIGKAVEAFGSVDILVNCAGNTVRGGITELTESQWDSVISLHLKGHFLAAQAAARVMMEQDHGRIITVASRSAFETLPASKKEARSSKRKPSSVAYAAAKAGILGFTSTLALELWETGITVNSLLPSATTDLFPSTGPRAVGGLPPSLDLDPATCAPIIVYLATDLAEHISGRFFYASGGDVCLYSHPLQVDGGASIVRKYGTWTVPELDEMISPLLGGNA